MSQLLALARLSPCWRIEVCSRLAQSQSSHYRSSINKVLLVGLLGFCGEDQCSARTSHRTRYFRETKDLCPFTKPRQKDRSPSEASRELLPGESQQACSGIGSAKSDPAPEVDVFETKVNIVVNARPPTNFRFHHVEWPDVYSTLGFLKPKNRITLGHALGRSPVRGREVAQRFRAYCIDTSGSVWG